jgi:hypothetical protein
MAAPNEKLAESLDVLKALQEGGHRVFRSDDFSRVHRERLVENGFLQDVMKGWQISSSPGARQMLFPCFGPPSLCCFSSNPAALVRSEGSDCGQVLDRSLTNRLTASTGNQVDTGTRTPLSATLMGYKDRNERAAHSYVLFYNHAYPPASPRGLWRSQPEPGVYPHIRA